MGKPLLASRPTESSEAGNANTDSRRGPEIAINRGTARALARSCLPFSGLVAMLSLRSFGRLVLSKRIALYPIG